MSAEGARQAPMMPLRELVDRYLSAAARFGIPVALSSFALSPAETERRFSGHARGDRLGNPIHSLASDGVPAKKERVLRRWPAPARGLASLFFQLGQLRFSTYSDL